MTTTRLFLIAGAIALACGSAHAQAGLNDLEVAHSAYTADVIDIAYGKLALSKSKNAEVRKFAELMISDHTAVNEGAAALLAKLGAKPQDNDFSKALNEGAAKQTAKMQALSGKAFDLEYAKNELAYHQTVNRIVGDIWIPNIQNAEVKTFLSQALVTFRAHEGHARRMVEVLSK